MKNILIVEDDKDYQKILENALKKEGFSTVVANDGEMALNVIKNVDHIDVIILDLLMPKMDGQTFYYHLRNTLHDETPVIVLTNLSTAPYPVGIEDFLVKTNISISDLVEKVKKIAHDEIKEKKSNV